MCVALFVLATDTTARAGGSKFELAWTSPSVGNACISQEELKHDVSQRLGRDPFASRGQGEVVIEGLELPAPPGHLRARIAQRDGAGRVLGTRELEATSCEELRRSAAFVVFLIVDPDAAFGGAPTLLATEKTPEKKPSSEEPAPPGNRDAVPSPGPEPSAKRPSEAVVLAPRRAPPNRGLRFDLGLSLMISNGLLPKPDVGPALSLGVVPWPLPIRLEWRMAYRLPLTAALGEDFRAVQQEWRACYSPRLLGGLFATACGGVTWIAILPDAKGLAGGDLASKTIFSPTLGVGSGFETGAMRFFVDFGLARPSPRYAFNYADEGRDLHVYEVSRTVWSIGIGASRSFL